MPFAFWRLHGLLCCSTSEESQLPVLTSSESKVVCPLVSLCRRTLCCSKADIAQAHVQGCTLHRLIIKHVGWALLLNLCSDQAL